MAYALIIKDRQGKIVLEHCAISRNEPFKTYWDSPFPNDEWDGADSLLRCIQDHYHGFTYEEAEFDLLSVISSTNSTTK